MVDTVVEVDVEVVVKDVVVEVDVVVKKDMKYPSKSMNGLDADTLMINAVKIIQITANFFLSPKISPFEQPTPTIIFLLRFNICFS